MSPYQQGEIQLSNQEESGLGEIYFFNNLNKEKLNSQWNEIVDFGTSVQRSSRSAFGRPTGNDVSGH